MTSEIKPPLVSAYYKKTLLSTICANYYHTGTQFELEVALICATGSGDTVTKRRSGGRPMMSTEYRVVVDLSKELLGIFLRVAIHWQLLCCLVSYKGRKIFSDFFRII